MTKKVAKAKKYEGATVLEPSIGFYYPKTSDRPETPPDDRTAEGAVAIFDFASLYPMEMISNNVCYSTLIFDKNEVIRLREKGRDIDEHEWVDGETHETRYVAIVQDQKAVLPTLLMELYQERKAIKKQMEFEQDSIRYNLLDKRQKAVKVSLNVKFLFHIIRSRFDMF